jgi:hypothetical protein
LLRIPKDPPVKPKQNGTGGTSTAEYGTITFNPYIFGPTTAILLVEDNRQILNHNPCKFGFGDDDDHSDDD